MKAMSQQCKSNRPTQGCSWRHKAVPAVSRLSAREQVCFAENNTEQAPDDHVPAGTYLLFRFHSCSGRDSFVTPISALFRPRHFCSTGLINVGGGTGPKKIFQDGCKKQGSQNDFLVRGNN
jgi:hypothetical protein